MSKQIQEKNRLYDLLCPLVQFATRCHYNRFVVRGIENLPADGPYIIAPCHQQALMEPLAVLRFAPKPPVFLARADIFAQPTIRAILTFLRILPVYRIRDGQEKLSRNKDIFDQCQRVLLDEYPLCLMAEGRHNNRHHLLDLRKGLFRIAGETQLALGERSLYIIPTGIYFDDYERPYSNVVVNIGTPIPVRPFMESYQQNQPVALNLMRDTLAPALSQQMLDIRNEEHYDEILTLCHVLNGHLRNHEGVKNNAWNRFLMRQRIARQMDGLTDGEPVAKPDENTWEETLKLKSHCHRLHLDEKMLSDHWSLPVTVFALLILAAFIVLAVTITPLRLTLLFFLLCYPLLLIPTHLIARKAIKDPQFRSTANFGIRFILSILCALVIPIVFACTHGAWMNALLPIGSWWGLVSLAIIILSARLAAPLVNILRDTLHNTYFWILSLSGHLNDVRRIYHNLIK